jgi:hypothetical protein
MPDASIVDAYLERLKTRFGVETDEKLSERLEVGKSTIATWRRRGLVPHDVCGRLLASDQIDFFDVVHRYIADSLADSAIGLKILMTAAMKLARDLPAAQVGIWADWIADNRNAIFLQAVKNDDPARTDERVEVRYVASRVAGIALRADQLITPKELKALRSRRVSQ